MFKTFKYRLFPTKHQRTELTNTLEFCRWVYNKSLETRKLAWENGKVHVSHYDTQNMLPIWKEEFPELKQVHSQVLQEVTIRVDLAYQAFFRRIKAGEKPGYPRFKSKGRYDSFTFTQYGFRLLDDSTLKLSNIGNVKIKLTRPIQGKIKTLTIQCDGIGNWYACFSCEVPIKPLPPIDNPVGIDVGLNKFMTLSNGQTIDNPRFFRKEEKALAKAQRKLSKQPKGSKERAKARKVVAHIHQRIANKRKDFAHKVSSELVIAHNIICFEDLNIKGMLKNHNLAKSIADAAWNQTIRFTIYKAEEAGGKVVLVNPKNTSKMCSQCGRLVEKTLSDRIHKCSCGLVIDRDLNASINILRLGLQTVGKNP